MKATKQREQRGSEMNDVTILQGVLQARACAVFWSVLRLQASGLLTTPVPALITIVLQLFCIVPRALGGHATQDALQIIEPIGFNF